MEWTTDDGNTAALACCEGLGAKPLPIKVFYRIPVAGDAGPAT